MPAEQYFDDYVGIAQWAEHNGFDYVKITEHYLHPYGGYCPSPLTFLAAVAARTERIRLMTGCTLPVFHHPVQLASHAAMVDALSHGRLDVGFARAYLPHEFETFQVPMDGSRARFEATVQAVVRLWSEEGVTEETDYFRFRDATILPRPVQRPHPPVWVAAVKSEESFTRIGEMGFGLLINPSVASVDAANVERYRSAFQSHHGHKGWKPRVAASLPLLVAPTDEQANELADPLLRRYLDVWASAVEPWDDTASRDYATYTGMGRFIRSLTPKDCRLSGSAMIGSPERIVRRVTEFQEKLGVDVLLWQVDFGGASGEVARRSLELFVDQVADKISDL
ncbi:hypothetical protein ADL21_00845 [Streptomyces albus subsp. albus]|nr:hypothetical protein ADL21_00845 [Streptomyces albus subsp. albus]